MTDQTQKRIRTTEKQNKQKVVKENHVEEKTEQVVPFASATESLMPELEALVKKNPNLLIGCGG